MHQISAAWQDYLEAILNLSETTSSVRITDLAAHLGVAKSSATETVKIMVRTGHLLHQRYGPLQLTQKGLEQAKRIRHRHNVLKEFLVSVLGVNNETADKEACLMEHAISADTTEKLVSFLERKLS